MVRRITVTGLLMVAGMFGQRSDTIWQSLSNQSGTPATSFQSVSVNNIGQTGHTIYVTLPNACSPPVLVGGLFYSWDNITFTPFGYQSTGSSVALTATLSATGAYPYVQVRFTYNGGCNPTGVFYTGVVNSPFPLGQGTLTINTPVQLAKSDGTINNNYVPQPLIGGAVYVWDAGTTGTAGLVGVNVEALTSAPINVAAGTTARVTLNANNPNNRIYASHMELTTDTAASTATLIEGIGATCGSNTVTIGTWTLGIGSTLNVGKFRTTNAGYNLCIVAVTGTIKGMITYGMLASFASNGPYQ